MKKWLVMLCVLVMVIGCGTTRKWTIEMSESDMKNAEASRIVAKNLLTTWSLNSGFIRSALGAAGMAKLPQECVSAMDEMDALAAKKLGELTDFDLGSSLGLRVIMLSSIVKQTLETYFPDVLGYIPGLLL